LLLAFEAIGSSYELARVVFPDAEHERDFVKA
jgi:hypothetical protein